MVNMTCIYKISNSLNDKVYIGSAIDFTKRKNDHLKRLRKQSHHNIHLQRHFVKYGEQSLYFGIVEVCEKDSMLEREQHYIDSAKSRLFNINPKAGSNLGRVFTEATRRKISIARMGKCYLSNAELEIRRKRMLGNKYGSLINVTDEYREMQSRKTKGSKNGRAKINEKVALLIKKHLLNGDRQSDIARKYGVSRFTVWAIKEKKQWV